MTQIGDGCRGSDRSIVPSPLGFGGAPLGNLYKPLDDAKAQEVLRAAWQSGFRHFDTAPYYGFGLSERRLGDFLREYDRNSVTLSTKVGRLLSPVRGKVGRGERMGFCSPMPFQPVYDYSYGGVMRSYEDSLQRLGLASVDILLVHDIGILTHGEEANKRHFRTLMEGGYLALSELREAGDIAAIGLGVNEVAACEQAMDHGDFDCFLVAGCYTLLHQEALDSFFPRCAARGSQVIVGGPYNSGILAGGVKSHPPGPYNYTAPDTDTIERVRMIEDICDEHNVRLAAAALQFPLMASVVSAVIPGLRSVDEVSQTTELYDTKIPASLWADLKNAGLIHPETPTL